VVQGLSMSFWKVQGHSEHNPVSTFLHIIIKDTDMRSSETYTECYRQYIQYIWFHPGLNPIPPKREIADYFIEDPTRKPYRFSFVALQTIYSILLVRPLGSTPPTEMEIAEYLKNNIEVPTPKPYTFLPFVSRTIWWYIGQDHTEWSCPPLHRKFLNMWKTVEIPTPKPYSLLIRCIHQ
jgi:hypothetical protein